MQTIKLWNGKNSVEMHCYMPEKRRGDGAVIIFAGGGYSHRAYHEAEP